MLRKVKVENGILEGLPAADPRITSFKGVPFAAPPIGENRWRAPQPAADWEGVYEAYKFAPISMQAPTGVNKEDVYTWEWAVDPDIPMGEDCLYLNVWTPAKSTDEKLPVFVWYFGGGLQVGNTAEMEFDGERIARRGVVVVTVNYRLNVFGFMCHPEITAENPDAPANFGNLDQQYGTRWVKRNIAAFGGDPDNITIGGQSSGGGSVMSQVASPQNEGLFQKAIVDSGVAKFPYSLNIFGPDLTLSQAEQEGVKFFDFLGIKSLKEARELEAFYLRDKMMEYKKSWGTIVDDQFAIGNTNDLYMQNKCQQVPMMFGHTATEFPIRPKADTVEEFEAFAKKEFGEDADKFLEICASPVGSLKEMLHKATTQHLEYSIRLFAKKKAETGNKMPMYYWLFGPEMPGWDNPGVFHSSDLWFFFETFSKCWRPFTGKHYDLSRKMCNYWANFIRSGDPNGKDADGCPMPDWKPYTVDEPERMIFADDAYTCSDGPGELMSFLLEHS